MTINFPNSRSEVANRIRTDVQSELPNSNPFLRNSYLNALIVGYAGRVFDFYLQLRELIRQMFMDTATGTFLERWGSYKGITRNPASQALGDITITGIAGTPVPVNTEFQSAEGITYKTQSLVNILNNSFALVVLTRTAQTAKGETATPHGLAVGNSITISGATETEYNGIFTVSGVPTAYDFEYQITGAPSFPATGSPQLDYVGVTVAIQSDDFGQATNLEPGAVVTITTPIIGVDDNATVQFNGIQGGADIETDDELRVRILNAYQNPFALFNVSSIVDQAKKVPGVTRVFVYEITPAPGQVTIYFVRDNDANIIPNPTEVTTVKNKILEIKPAHVADVDVIVEAPVANSVNFNFSGILPNTPSMQESIRRNLQALFQEQTQVGQDLLEYAYLAAIWQTVDYLSGERLQNFNLASPSGDILVAPNEIATLGMITFP